MAVTKISDVVTPEVYDGYVMHEMLEKSIFFQSGIATPNQMINDFLSGGGQTVNIPFISQLVNEEANVSSDDDASLAVPKKLAANKNIACRQSLNQVWSSMDLTAALAGVDPLQQVVMSVSEYWTNRLMARLVSSCEGVLADNVANDAGDMVYDISGGVADVNKFSAEACIAALLTMGDRLDEITGIAVHSVVYARMVALDLVDTTPDSLGQMRTSYFGKPIFVSDSLTATGSPAKYTTILFGQGAVSYGAGLPKTPSEIERSALAGDGGGQEYLVDRKEFVCHVNGTQYLVAGIAGKSPTIAELAAAAQWDRVFPRKRIKVAFLLTNG